jgi:hypothetical protein
VDPLVLLVRDVFAIRDERLAGLREPVGLVDVDELIVFGRVWSGHEHRASFELAPAALRTRWDLVEFMQCDGKATLFTSE